MNRTVKVSEHSWAKGNVSCTACRCEDVDAWFGIARRSTSAGAM